MSNRNRITDDSASRQGALFDTTLSEGSLDISLNFRHTLSSAMHKSGKDRYQIAAEVSRLSGREISKEMLDKCCGSDVTYGLRAELLPAINYVVSVEPARILMHPTGWDIIGPDDKDLLRLASLLESRRTIDDEIMTLRAKRGFNK